jgi:hypothetical protein
MWLTKLSLAGNNLIIPGQGELLSDIPAGDGKTGNLFLPCSYSYSRDVSKGIITARIRHLVAYCKDFLQLKHTCIVLAKIN